MLRNTVLVIYLDKIVHHSFLSSSSSESGIPSLFLLTTMEIHVKFQLPLIQNVQKSTHMLLMQCYSRSSSSLLRWCGHTMIRMHSYILSEIGPLLPSAFFLRVTMHRSNTQATLYRIQQKSCLARVSFLLCSFHYKINLTVPFLPPYI